MSSLAGMVKLVLNQLHEHGMVQTLETAEGEVYTATPRYRLQVRELAANELFERCAFRRRVSACSNWAGATRRLRARRPPESPGGAR